jgi:hypothetical protein
MHQILTEINTIPMWSIWLIGLTIIGSLFVGKLFKKENLEIIVLCVGLQILRRINK